MDFEKSYQEKLHGVMQTHEEEVNQLQQGIRKMEKKLNKITEHHDMEIN